MALSSSWGSIVFPGASGQVVFSQGSGAANANAQWTTPGDGTIVLTDNAGANPVINASGLGSGSNDLMRLQRGSNNILQVTAASSAVQGIQATGAAAGGPTVAPIGSAGNINLNVNAKGTGVLNLGSTNCTVNSAGNVTANALTLAVPLTVANGGTGTSGTPTNGQLPIGNGSGFTLAALTQGSNITITNGAGTITIAATGGSPGGSNTQVQFNNSGSFGGDANFTYSSGAAVLGTSLRAPTIYGSTSASGNLNIISTSNGTKGRIYLNSDGSARPLTYIDANCNFVIDSASDATQAQYKILNNGVYEGLLGINGASAGIRLSTAANSGQGDVFLDAAAGNGCTFQVNTTTVARVNSTSLTLTSADVVLSTAGKGLQLKSGSNGRVGSGTLVGGTLAVSNTSVTANTYIFITDQGGTVTNLGSLYVASQTAGTGFTVTSSNVLDTSTFKYILFEVN